MKYYFKNFFSTCSQSYRTIMKMQEIRRLCYLFNVTEKNTVTPVTVTPVTVLLKMHFTKCLLQGVKPHVVNHGILTK